MLNQRKFRCALTGRAMLALAVCSSIFTVSQATAAELIGNLPADLSDTTLGTIITGVEARSKAVSFTTPAGLPYELNSATFVMQFTGDAAEPGALPQVALWSDAAGNPGAQLSVLDNPSVLGARDFYTFNASSPIALLPSTTYWMMVNGNPANTNPAADAYYWNGTTTSITPTGIAAFERYAFSATTTPPTATSTVFNSFSVDATLVPEPTTMITLLIGAMGIASARRR